MTMVLGSCGGGSGDADSSAATRSIDAPSIDARKFAAAAPFTGQLSGNGWYWNPNEGGTGFMFEAQGSRAFVAFFLYEDGTGKPIWYAAYGDMVAGPGTGEFAFAGDLRLYRGGQPVSATSNASALVTSTSVGEVRIAFAGGRAQVSLPGGRSIDAQRFVIDGSRYDFAHSTAPTAQQPEVGWYWNPTEGGRGYAIEVQNDRVFMGMFHYSPDGSPTWNVVTGDLASGTAALPFQLYSGGQTLTSGYVNPGKVDLPPFTLSFRNTCAGQMQLLEGPAIKVRRFRIDGSNQPPGAECVSVSSGLYVQAPGLLAQDPVFEPGDAVFGKITAPGQQYTYGYRLVAGTTYTVVIEGAPQGSGTLPGPVVSTYDITLQGGGPSTGSLTFTPSSSGVYYFVAQSAGAETGTFILSVNGTAAGLPTYAPPDVASYAGLLSGSVEGRLAGQYSLSVGQSGLITGNLLLQGNSAVSLAITGSVVSTGAVTFSAVGEGNVFSFSGQLSSLGVMYGTWSDGQGPGGLFGGTTTVVKTAGDVQAAAVGAAVATTPQVVVRDSKGGPLAGVDVTFRVTAGGGRVAQPVVRTDAAGIASPGAWTFGPSRGENALSAHVPGAAAVTFTGFGLATSPAIKLTLKLPLPNQSDTAFNVSVDFSPVYQPESIRATVAGVTKDLVYAGWGPENGIVTDRSCAIFCRSHGARFSLANASGVPALVVVTATDVLGNITDVAARVVPDAPPKIFIDSPLDRSVLRSKVDLVARCVDDDPAGCTSLVATLNDVPISGVTKDGVSRTLDLAAFDGKMAVLTLKATDSAGRRSELSRWIYVESSDRLVLLDEVPGPVWDALGTRILYLDLAGQVPAIRIKDSATGAVETVETGSDVIATFGSDYGFLTPRGAVYVDGVPTAFANQFVPGLFEWRDGIRTSLGAVAATVRLAGDWIVYTPRSQTDSVWKRNLATGVSEIVAERDSYDGDVAANGDVVFTRGVVENGAVRSNVVRVRNGAETALTNDPSSGIRNDKAITDGRNVVYLKSYPASGAAERTRRYAVHDGVAETTLPGTAPSNVRAPAPLLLYSLGFGEASFEAQYAVAGGYVAYIRRDAFGTENVWRHGPSGEQQVTFLNGSFALETVGPDGTIFYTRGGLLYRSRIGSEPDLIGSSVGRVFYRNGKPLYLLGRSVFEVR